MKERPILFSGGMVRAILAGTKTQTRRVINPQFNTNWGSGCPHQSTFALMSGQQQWRDAFAVHVDRETSSGHWEWIWCPYGKAGDRLWVRETWSPVGERRDHLGFHVRYKADSAAALGAHGATKWRSSIFMPRWASRLTLEITGVRVERLHEITDADAIAEGVTAGDVLKEKVPTARDVFRYRWDEINGTKYPWSSNPWCWCLMFKRAAPDGLQRLPQVAMPIVQVG